MGNWRTVELVGTIDPEDADAARKFVDVGRDGTQWHRFHCLCHTGPSLCGIGQWIPAFGGDIKAMGNLAERDYGVEDVRDALIDLVKIAPSLELKVHCGGDYEVEDCIATVTVHNGVVRIGDPEVEKVGAGLSERGAARLFGMLLGGPS